MQFSRQDRRILKKLADKLPSPPMPGWDRDAICAAVGQDWREILKVMLGAARGVELRQPGLPLIRYARNGYCLVGSTDKKGHLRLS